MHPSRYAIAVTLLAVCAPVAAQTTLASHPDASATRRVRLAADTVVFGVPCGATGDAYAEIYAGSGRVAECPLSEEATMHGHRLARGTWVVLRPDGGLRQAWLERDTRVGEVTCKGSGYKDWVTEFDEQGRLRMCFLPETTRIQGIPCRAGTVWGELTGGVACASIRAACSPAAPSRVRRQSTANAIARGVASCWTSAET